ncbi:MAG: 50S ribosomal protein L32 [Candidatus Melainabacteria bacterium]|nr:50S ribosomal protein L32 [Candidatus Melainabacteria bacterium]
MPVPKKRLGRSDQGHRRAKWKAFMPAKTTCPNCGAPRLMHTLCGVCGYYKDRIVSARFAANSDE